MNTKNFPLGSHLCREPMPAMSELKRDMELLKRQGFNLIKLQEHWMIDEPSEGRYDFSRYEELIAHAAKLDLAVYLGLTCEQAPHWLYAKHPDCRMVLRSGVPVLHESQTTLSGSDGKPGPCFDHPGASADQSRFITKLVQTLGRFENITHWNTWQEIGYWAEGFLGSHVCYCTHTLAAWRVWLREKYGDLDALNRRWNSRYDQWDDIVPDRLTRPTACPQEFAWRYFMGNVQIANVLKSRAAAIRAADPLKRTVFAHKGGPDLASSRDWNYARCQDFLGSSSYPAWGCGYSSDDGFARPFGKEYALRTELWNTIVYQYDYIRSANLPGRPIWAAEFQGGPISTGFHKGRVPSADDIRRWMLGAVSAGVSAISFWVTRAEIMVAEQNGFSLLDSVSESTPRLEEAGRVGRALNAHPELFAQPTLQRAKAGILVNEDNYQVCSLLAQGGDNLGYSIRGWHRLLWDLNIPLDLVSVEHNELAQYPVLILPFPLSLAESTAAKLAQFVADGGCLISEAAPGRINEEGYCNRGELSPTLAALFGVRQTGFTMVREPNGGARWSPAERTWGEYLDAQMLTGTGPLAGHQLRANIYLETLEALTGAEPVLKTGESVAGVRRCVGKGQAWLLGTYVGHNGTAYRDPAIHAVVRALLGVCGVTPEHTGKLIVRKRVTPGKEAWLFTNPTGESVTEKVSVAGWQKVSDLFGQTVPVAGGFAELTVASLDVRVLIVEERR